MHLSPFVTDLLGKLAFEFARVQPLLPTYGHLLLSALFPIFTGSYASLSRPSSAAKQERKTRPGQEEDGPDEEDEQPIKMEGLSPSDAIMFPLLAGATLTGLYFLIKWLEDPALLNKILNWYFAGFSIFSVSRMVSDGLDVFHSYLFPHDYVDGGILYHVDPKRRRAIAQGVNTSTHSPRTSSLPGIFSRFPLPKRISSLFWTLHIIPTRKLTFNLSSSLTGTAKFSLGIHGVEGLLVGLSTVLYYNFVSKPWYLTNLSGFGFSYGALQLMSPTTFTTGTMLLGALLCYDFYMVFRTPMMVTVAKSLDIPIKLLFPRPAEPDAKGQALSMLGLGDVVLPGIIIGLALRFDLYLFYLRKQKKVVKDVPESEKQDTSITTVALSNSATTITKTPYVPVTEAWGDAFWTSTILPSILSRPSAAALSYIPRNKFPTPYFTAGLCGYIAGIVATLTAMQISSHPQPALIYLVPGVLTALWGTALLRGELKAMWNYSDAAEEDETEKVKREEKGTKEKGEGSSDTKTESDDKMGDKDATATDAAKETEKPAVDKKPADDKTAGSKNAPRTLFSFSITAPPAYWTGDDDEDKVPSQGGEIKEIPATPVKEGEHVEKKRRIH